MRIIFMGTPNFAVPSLDALVAAGHKVVAVYTQPPRRAGRGKALSPTPVHLRADTLGVPVRHPERLRDPVDQYAFAALGADVAVVAAYGLILPQPVLDAPQMGCINVHASLLPRWRGAAPIQRAILAGDNLTGVTIMQMEAGLDTGAMLARAVTPIDGKTAGELTAELAQMGADALIQVLDNGPPAVSQPENGVTYATKIDKAEARIDFAAGARAVERQIRAFAPVPGAWFEHGGERIRVLAGDVIDGGADPGTVIDDGLVVGCGAGLIRLSKVQRAGRAAMSAADLLRGFAIPVGTILT
jgi:methionyl-tRNA formyltransferase